MRVRYVFLLACLFSIATGAQTEVGGQETVSYEKGPNGETIKVTRRVSQQLTPVTEMQTREEKVLRPRVNTQYKPYQRSYLTPVTEYRWVSRMKGRWNPLVQPYWAQELEPFTRWESVQSTVHVPTTSTEWVEERRTVQTPVTKYRTVQNETIRRVAVSTPPASLQPSSSSPVQTPMVASRPAPIIGGQRMHSDIPRTASGWRSQDGTLRR